MKKNIRSINWTGKKAVALLVLVLVLSLAIEGALAFLVIRTRTIRNTFRPAVVEISSWGYNDLLNAGNVPMYVRASIIPAWVSNEDSNTVLSDAPVEGVDYTLEISPNWFLAWDGMYYRRYILEATSSIDFVSATQITQKDGYTLKILVVYGAIQSDPKEAVEGAWHAVTVNADGTLSEKPTA